MLLSKGKNIKTSEKFQLIYETIAQTNFKQMTTYFCELLEVSRSGYYSYINASASRAEREKADVKVKDVILKAFNRRGYKKGSRSIKIILENEFSLLYSRKRIQRIMRKYNIVCPIRQANTKTKIAKETKQHQVVHNKLNRKSKLGTPGKVEVTDMTYL